MKANNFSKTITPDTLLSDFTFNRYFKGSALGICQSLGLRTLMDVVRHYHEHYSFSTSAYRNESDKYIQAFCSNYFHVCEEKLLQKKVAPDLDEVQLEAFYRFFSQCLEDFPIRHRFLLSAKSPSVFYRDYIQGGKSFMFLERFDPTTITRLHGVRQKLLQYAHELVEKPNSFYFDELLDTCVSKFGCDRQQLEAFRKQAEQGKFPLFGFISFLMKGDYLIGKHYGLAIKHGYNWLIGFKNYPNDVVSKKMGLATEFLYPTVEQLLKLLVEKLEPIAAFKKYIQRQSNYCFENQADMIWVTSKNAEEINKAEDACLSTFIDGVIVNTFLVTGRSLFWHPDLRMQNSYLIKQDILDVFNIQSFFKQHINTLNSLTNKELEAKIQTLIRPYLRVNAIQYAPIAKALVMEILSDGTPQSQNPQFTNDLDDYLMEREDPALLGPFVEHVNGEKKIAKASSTTAEEPIGYYEYLAAQKK